MALTNTRFSSYPEYMEILTSLPHLVGQNHMTSFSQEAVTEVKYVASRLKHFTADIRPSTLSFPSYSSHEKTSAFEDRDER